MFCDLNSAQCIRGSPGGFGSVLKGHGLGDSFSSFLFALYTEALLQYEKLVNLVLPFPTHEVILRVILATRSSSFCSIMEKKQGFFSALKDEVARGLSPTKLRPSSPAKSRTGLTRRSKGVSDVLIARSGSLRPVQETLSPLREGPEQIDGIGDWVGMCSRIHGSGGEGSE
ncbi:hypothetical protein Droror1_Dr00024645 [Drosera rotundifolia]